MGTLRLSSEDIMKMYVDANVSYVMSNLLTEALEMQIPQVSEGLQQKFKREVKLRRDDPEYYALEYMSEKITKKPGGTEEAEIMEKAFGQESPWFKAFYIICEKFMDDYEQNAKSIQETLTKMFAADGIKLIIE